MAEAGIGAVAFVGTSSLFIERLKSRAEGREAILIVSHHMEPHRAFLNGFDCRRSSNQRTV